MMLIDEAKLVKDKGLDMKVVKGNHHLRYRITKIA